MLSLTNVFFFCWTSFTRLIRNPVWREENDYTTMTRAQGELRKVQGHFHCTDRSEFLAHLKQRIILSAHTRYRTDIESRANATGSLWTKGETGRESEANTIRIPYARGCPCHGHCIRWNRTRNRKSHDVLRAEEFTSKSLGLLQELDEILSGASKLLQLSLQDAILLHQLHVLLLPVRHGMYHL